MRLVEVSVDANEGFLLGAGLVGRVDLVELFPPGRLLTASKLVDLEGQFSRQTPFAPSPDRAKNANRTNSA
jgi:hypothetical protein